MSYIAFIAALFGAAGVAGGIERGSIAGTIVSAVFHVGGIIVMAVCGEPEEEDGGD